MARKVLLAARVRSWTADVGFACRTTNTEKRSGWLKHDEAHRKALGDPKTPEREKDLQTLVLLKRFGVTEGRCIVSDDPRLEP